MVNSKGQFCPKYAPIQIGERFTKWIVLGKGDFKYNQQKWKVRCDCGIEKQVASQHLRNQKSTCCIKCAGKKKTLRSLLKNKYSNNRRNPYVQIRLKEIYEEQKGLCAICGKRLPELSKCAWDHDHTTGEGRGLLHRGCNVFLGYIERYSNILENLSIYIHKYKINA